MVKWVAKLIRWMGKVIAMHGLERHCLLRQAAPWVRNHTSVKNHELGGFARSGLNSDTLACQKYQKKREYTRSV